MKVGDQFPLLFPSQIGRFGVDLGRRAAGGVGEANKGLEKERNPRGRRRGKTGAGC